MKQLTQSKLMIVMLAVLLSSCSVTRMRYTRGFNIHFLSKNDKQPEDHKSAKKKKRTLSSSVLNTETAHEAESINILGEAPMVELNHENTISIVSKRKPVMEYKFWNRLYTQVDKVEAKFYQLKPKNNGGVHKTMSTHGDGTSGVWGTLGFIFGLISIWPLAIIFSIIGLGRNRNNRGLAIAGLVLGIIWGIISIGLTLATM